MTAPRTIAATFLICTFAWAIALAAPAKPKPETPPAPRAKPAPPKELTSAERAEVEAGAAKLGKEVDALRAELKGKPDLLALLPDVQIYHNAVRYPLAYHEPIDLAKARKAIAEGTTRAAALRAGKPAWATASGPRGYVSRVDASVQPYMLLVPDGYKPGDKKPHRLDLFCHGRDEKLTELNFISGKVGNAPAGGQFVALLYGRMCVASKFAGEVDCFEAIDDIKRRHAIDNDRVVLTGFSMGGASVWHLTAHYADQWAATSPGAGFAETAAYQGLAQKGELDKIPWYEQRLWHLYDATDYAANFANVPCIAYAGELDKQKQSGDVMEKALAAEGLKLERLFGPNTAHAYEKEAKKELDRRLDAYAAKGRDSVPLKVRFTTWTLRYNQMYWVTVDGLERHWEQARVDGEFAADGPGPRFRVKTRNVSALTLSHPHPPVAPPGATFEMFLSAEVDGIKVDLPTGRHNATSVSLAKVGGKWTLAEAAPPAPLGKTHGLQGPVDDAFMDSFVIVRPTGKPLSEKSGAWAAAECDRAVREWQKIFRGEARVKSDTEVAEADIADHNLVLFGDPSSNKLIARMAGKLPIGWTNGTAVTVGKGSYPAGQHLPILIYPNPLNPKRYVVLNSGFTFREGLKISNARQTPRLPDYAVVDVTEPATDSAPGKIVDAGFFGERWELLPDGGRGALGH